ncbi:hypothetical protein [Cyanobium sp. CH-040]|uniref:hypothetical protein n=1 Tax=Cyanobium sp. CH-040 TaxID=2823708 RepID=UPI0020CB8AFD|nr:hypothetical protein [Cyanobium sp. CH-040]MCP9928107.1 hypothetical protein [Cyanobium sp. CH-040]
MVSDQPHHHEGAATPSTVLKWSSDGELSAIDLQRLVDRLQQTDPVAEALLHPSHFAALNPGSC